MALGNLDQIEHPELFTSWLRALVVRTAATRFRRTRRHARLRRRNTVPLQQLASGTAPPDVVAELDGIYRSLECLPVEARVVFILRRVERMSTAEVAARLARSMATIKRRLVRAERLLDRRLADVRTPRVRDDGTPVV
jgi:RNA polymerase sigma factor (sigma-70 family)